MNNKKDKDPLVALERRVSQVMGRLDRRSQVNPELVVFLEGQLRRARSGEITEFVGMDSHWAIYDW